MMRQDIFTPPDVPRYGEPLADYIADLQKVLDEAPEALRNKVQIAFDTTENYGSWEPTCEITLIREATPEEAEADRKAKIAAAERQAATAARNAEMARQHLEKLRNA